MGYDSEKVSTSSSVDPSWSAFLDDLHRHGVNEAVIAENMEFIKSFVHSIQESDAVANGGPKKKKPPVPAPRRAQQDSTSSTATSPPSLHPLSRGAPPHVQSGVDPSWVAFLDDLHRHGVDEAVIAENMDFIKSFVCRAQESDAVTNGGRKKKPPPPAPRCRRRAQQDSTPCQG
jgi:hypothetical protein